MPISRNNPFGGGPFGGVFGPRPHEQTRGWIGVDLAVQMNPSVVSYTVHNGAPFYYHCERSGFRVPYARLVRDGELDIYVEDGWQDEPHPQRYGVQFGPDGLRDNPAPPQDELDVTSAVVLVIDGISYAA